MRNKMDHINHKSLFYLDLQKLHGKHFKWKYKTHIYTNGLIQLKWSG